LVIPRAVTIGLVLAAVLASTAGAQSPSLAPPPAKATPEAIAAARAEGDAILAAAQAQDVFDN